MVFLTFRKFSGGGSLALLEAFVLLLIVLGVDG